MRKEIAWMLGLAAAAVIAGCCRAALRTPATTSPASTAAVSAGKVFEGRASYYHDSLAGRRTASGERYRPRKLTAASRTLPFGTRLRVTRLDNGHSVVVRVNDRGPWGRRKRILDLSRAAARKLDMVGSGVVEVRAEVLEGHGP